MPDPDDKGPGGNSGSGENAEKQIRRLASDKAREYGHATITFNHVLLALVSRNPRDVDAVLGPKIKAASLMRMLDNDLKNVKNHPQDLLPGGKVELGTETGRMLKRADLAARNWSKPEDMFGGELLYAMLSSGKVDKNERSTTLDYVDMTLSVNKTLDAAQECRKSVDKLAADNKIIKQNNPGPVSSGPENRDEDMPENKAAVIFPIKKDSTLAEFGTNMNQQADGKPNRPVIGRDDEIEEAIRILARSDKNNPLLVGEPGVGKTAIVEGLVQRMNRGDVPDFLKGKNIVKLDLSGVVAGTKYRGDFEQRMKNLMKELLEHKEYIIFIDEIHTLMGAGSAEGSMDAANLLKPALSRGELSVIGSTTWDEYKQSIEKDGAMDRRFQTIDVQSPDIKKAKLMVRSHKERLENFHQVQYDDEALDAAAEMSSRYFSNDTNSQPDKGVTLADDAGVLVKLDSSRKDKRVTVADVATIVSKRTHIPVGNVTQNDIKGLRTLGDRLNSKVFNQEAAIKGVASAIQRSRTGMADPKKPVGSFLFLGPTGVGKTEVARQLAMLLFGDEKKMIRFDMSEYQEKTSVNKLVGSDPGYVGYDEGGQLTEKVRRNPYSVILFDEIEKAHPDVANVFLQILEDGRLTDGQGRTVDFKNTIIIMTSNAITSTNVLKNKGFGKSSAVETAKANAKEIIEILKQKGFRPEFINRLDEVVNFNSLPKTVMPNIVKKLISEMKEERDGVRPLDLQIGDGVVDWLVEQGWENDGAFGARPYKRLVNKKLADEFSNAVMDGTLVMGMPATVKIGLNEMKTALTFDYNQAASGNAVATASFDAKRDGLLNNRPANEGGGPIPSVG
ncbi:MAG TPA: ATP-dependent Clp protease ATP-binding subunit [Patescibacteria group bacterium]|nr:ATP-dependent Clp protease ATP-binding subunit [Patescibacteria group bacterium]